MMEYMYNIQKLLSQYLRIVDTDLGDLPKISVGYWQIEILFFQPPNRIRICRKKLSDFRILHKNPIIELSYFRIGSSWGQHILLVPRFAEGTYKFMDVS